MDKNESTLTVYGMNCALNSWEGRVARFYRDNGLSVVILEKDGKSTMIQTTLPCALVTDVTTYK